MSHFFSIYFAKIRTFCLKAKIITLFSAKSGPVALACSGKHCGLRFNDAGRYAQKRPPHLCVDAGACPKRRIPTLPLAQYHRRGRA